MSHGTAVQRRHRCRIRRGVRVLMRRQANETKSRVRGKISLGFRDDPDDEPSRRPMSGQMSLLARSLVDRFASEPPISRLGDLSFSPLAVRLHPYLDLPGREVSGGAA